MSIVPTRWKYREQPDRDRSDELAEALRIPATLAELLVQRGHGSVEQAKSFLRPTLASLSDPSEFIDLPKAAALIAATVRAGKTIVVHGDYDVDGQSATALLTRILRLADAQVRPFVPHRVRDGYDLGPAGVAFAAEQGASLIITCDCGTTAHEAVADAKARGMQVIVTDHHVPGALPPADAIVNPNRPDCPSTSKQLCGAGVAFKLAQALVTELGLPANAPLHVLDLVALATVADLVPLTGENRTLVRFGLKVLAQSRWAGVRALVDVAGLGGKSIRAGHVGFILAPRLNAVGRIGDAKDGLRLLLTDDEAAARDQARALEALNARRQAMDREILQEAVEEIDDHVDLDRHHAIVLAKDSWHPGVIGIVASRVVERYARPTFLIGLDGAEGKGSGRSVPGFDMHAALTRCADHLVKFGGHPMAAGLTIHRDRIDAFREAFNAIARAELSKDDLVNVQRVDVTASVDRLDPDLERLLRHLEPCGMGNPAPVFAVMGARAADVREVGNNHLKFRIEDQTGGLDAIAFERADRVPVEWLQGPVDVAFRLEENEFQGRVSLQARVVDLRPSS
ncbi:MAG: single-stranded-DNA-specific exonuclease RecJ [Gemmatimonadetes bacterium]|nr:single-stranded-DNA-specific exonuclease RecJ [Gemmatimonadota bacterium]